MKKMFVLVLIAISYNSYAQFGKVSIDVNDALIKQHEIALMHDSQNQIIDLSNTKGTPYYKEFFLSGNISMLSTGESLGYQMRYNIYNDEIEVKNSQDNSVSAVKKSPNILCKIQNDTYKYIEYTDKNKDVRNGYFHELVGGNVALVVKYECKYQPEKIGNPPVFKVTKAKFITQKSYYLLTDDQLTLISTKKKKFLANFGEQKAKVSTYISTNKLKLNSDRDLIRVITYYNSLL